MAHTALYRKLRPQNFEEVVGQDPIIKTLKNQIQSGRISHAYLFTGTRGTGKTSTAKIFARAVNCLEPTDGNPCNHCENCLRDLKSNDLNIMEIDAASNNGVENIRELREDVRYQPSDAKYKIYIIDEVHMLSIGAFNALLKTLEEPPAHAIFILATTDPHKIPDTILSRCQRYDFRRITGKVIQGVLKKYLDSEEILYEDKAIRFISKIADGALRDAHSILERCLAFYLNEELTLEKVLSLLGAVDNGVYEQLTADLLKKDISGLLHKTDDLIMQGRDLQQMILGEVAFLRDILIVKTMTEPESILDISQENMITYRAIADLTDESFIMYIIKELSRIEAEMKYEGNKRIILEMEWIKLCQPSLDKSSDNLLRRMEQIEKSIAEQPIKIVERNNKIKDEAKKKHRKPVELSALPEDVKKVIGGWRDIQFKIDPFAEVLLNNATPFYQKNNNSLLVIVESKTGLDYLEYGDRKQMLLENLEDLYQKKFEIEFITKEQFENKHNHSVDQVKVAISQLKEFIEFDVEVE